MLSLREAELALVSIRTVTEAYRNSGTFAADRDALSAGYGITAFNKAWVDVYRTILTVVTT